MAESKDKTLKLYWTKHIDTSSGMEPSAYGIKLQCVDGIYSADVHTERAKVELGRKGGGFTKTKPKAKK